MKKTKVILVPTDFSELSDKAISYAIDIAEEEGAKIFILHVVEMIQHCADIYCLESGIVAQMEKQSAAQALRMMKKQVQRFPRLKKLQYRADIKNGSPYDGIMQEISEKKIDLIIMGAHKKKGFIDRFLGSVADKVVRGVKCPVLLIKS